MGVREQAEHVVAQMYEEIQGRIDDLHTEIHALATNSVPEEAKMLHSLSARLDTAEKVLETLSSLVGRVEALEKPARNTGRSRTPGV